MIADRPSGLGECGFPDARSSSSRAGVGAQLPQRRVNVFVPGSRQRRPRSHEARNRVLLTEPRDRRGAPPDALPACQLRPGCGAEAVILFIINQRRRKQDAALELLSACDFSASCLSMSRLTCGEPGNRVTGGFYPSSV